MENNMPSPQEIAKQLRKPEGETGIAMGDKMSESNQMINSETFSCLDLKPNDKILEIGFGNGKLIQHLLALQPRIRYYGIDYSKEMVDEASKHNASDIENERIVLQKADISSIPYSDNTFDKIVTVNTIYFWESPKEVIFELYRVLKAGGRLCIGFRPKSKLANMEFLKYGFTLYEWQDVARMLKNAGFMKIDHHTWMEPPKEIEGKEVQVGGSCVWGIK